MMPNDNQSLVRLNVRLPTVAYDKLKRVAAANAVPMSALIRMLVVEWAEADARVSPAISPRP